MKALVATIALLTACADERAADPEPIDTLDAAAEAPPGAIDVPALPVPVTMRCAEGWLEETREDSAAQTCVPFSGEDPGVCDEGQILVPSQARCAPIEKCSEPAAPEGAIYVAVDARSPFLGTRARPFRSMSQAIAVASPGATIVLGPGAHPGSVVLDRDVTIVGRCAAQTHIIAAEGDIQNDDIGVVGVAAGHTTLRSLTIGPAATYGLVVGTEAGMATLEDVVVAGVLDVGITAYGHVEGSNVVVRDIRSVARPLSSAIAVPGGSARFDRLQVSDVIGDAMYVLEHGHVVLSDVLFERCTSPLDTEGGAALIVANASAIVRGGVFRDNTGRALIVPAGQVSATDLRVSDTGRAGIVAALDADVTLDRVVLERNQQLAMTIEASTLHMTDVVVRDVPDSTEVGGVGLYVYQGSHVDVSRFAVEHAREMAIAIDEGSVSGSDIEISDIEGTRYGRYGRGLLVALGATFDVDRVRIRRVRQAAISVSTLDEDYPDPLQASELRVRDLTVQDVFPQRLDNDEGFALNVSRRGVATLERALFERATTLAVQVTFEGELDATSLVVRDTRQRPDRQFGRGLESSNGGVVRLHGARFERNFELGVAAIDYGVIDIEDVAIVDTFCRRTPCETSGFGFAFASYGHSTFHARRFAIDGAELCGVHVWLEGEMDLSDGVVRGCPVGACLGEGYDFARISSGVDWDDNGQSADSMELPVPGAVIEL